MTMLPEAFDPSQIDPDGGSSGLPLSGPDGYLVRITDSSWVPVKDNPAHGRLVFDLDIMDGQHAGTTGSYGLNLGHSKAQTVEIAKKKLSAICHVVGVFSVMQDTSVLYGKPFRMVVEQQSNNPQYTDVKKILDQHGRTATEVKNAGPQATPAIPGAAAPVAAPPVAAPVAAPAAMPPAAPPVAAPVAASVPMAPPAAPAAPAAPVAAPAPVAPPVAAPPAAPAAAAPPAGSPPWAPQQ